MMTLKKVNKIYNPRTDIAVHALKDIDLTIEDGELTAIMGVSGSGKSTLLHILGCIDKATDGEYILNDYDVSKYASNTLAEIRNEEIGFVLQNFGLMNDKSVYENISYPLIFNPAVKYKMMKKLINEAAASVGISELIKKNVNEISGGQKQRVAIARAIVNRPNIILADEPTAALDKKTAFEIMEVFKELNGRGKTVVIVTHDRSVAEKCRRIIELNDGSIVSDSDREVIKKISEKLSSAE